MVDISGVKNCIKLEVEKWGRNRCSLYVSLRSMAVLSSRVQERRSHEKFAR